jgi:hypothetical protein
MTTWKAILRCVYVFALGATLVACKSDGDGNGAFSDALSRITGGRDNQPPVISGAPQSKIIAGQRFEFRPSVSDPDGGKLEFTIANKPRWSSFDARTGRLAGTPRASDVGDFRDIAIAVSDGEATRRLVFDVEVADTGDDGSGSGSGSGSGGGPGSGSGGSGGDGGVDPTPTPTGPTLPVGESQFRFTEIPEIVFVRGYTDREQLGIFHIDTGNRWAPGDLGNESGWRPRIDTTLELVDGSLAGVSYDPSTAELRYDGGGSGNQTAVVRLTAPGRGLSSERFRIRVLAPTIVWGVGAESRYPGIGLESSRVSWTDMQRAMRTDAGDSAPNVLLVTAGRYEGDFYIGRGKRNLYVIGEPGARPTLATGGINIDDVETGYLKNFELIDTVVDGSKFPTDRPVNVYVTQVYQHDSTRELNGFGTPDYEGDSEFGIVKAPNTQTHWIWNFHGAQMGGLGNLRHQFYMHGRPDGYLNINNIRVDASRNCSIIKSTKFFNRIRNSRLSALVDPSRPSVGNRADKLIDIASAGETVIYNNEFIGAYTPTAKGTQHGLISLRARRSWWGADSPAYPNLSLDPPRTSLADGGYLAPEGFTAGPETFVNAGFWDTVRGYDLGDPRNPYTFKKYIAFNLFRWIDEGSGRRSVLVDDGTAPRTAKSLGSVAEIWGTVPRNWVERSVTFLANNRYVGWNESDLPLPGRWMDLETYTPESLVTFQGPPPYAYPPPNRTAIDLGGEESPAGQAPAVALADWFML